MQNDKEEEGRSHRCLNLQFFLTEKLAIVCVRRVRVQATSSARTRRTTTTWTCRRTRLPGASPTRWRACSSWPGSTCENAHSRSSESAIASRSRDLSNDGLMQGSSERRNAPRARLMLGEDGSFVNVLNSKQFRVLMRLIYASLLKCRSSAFIFKAGLFLKI